ncbi:MAG: Stk1 family PASTA domain-containing Ser/Thr kinase [Clostridia bacterium]|nr:Stk1 family PASTA domain-containing Ser/Thr kinase [Clostridia bacterium]
MDQFERYVGQVFDKRYRIIKVIGIGGMAVVFEATDLLMRRNVAVKMLKDEINNDVQSVKRFINESKAVAMLSHPNIVNIYDVSVKDSLKYIVMELVEGITLKNYILKKGTLSFNEIMSITEQILLALDHAHQKGVVHRDIKPQNIMMLKNGSIKVADFGIAKLPNAETVTMTDKAIGTVFYISPEQASGKKIDRRSDIYSLGVTMYEMATGKLPFVADSPVTVAIMQVKNRPRPPRELNDSLPLGLEQIIMGAMEKNPDNRFQSAAQMLRHLAQVKNNPRTVFKMPKTETTSDMSSEGGQAMPDNVKKLTRPTRASRSMFPVVAGVASSFLIVFIISAVVVFTKLGDSLANDTSEQIVIPKFIDSFYSEDFEAELEKGNYNVEVEYIYDAKYPQNQIIGQDPLPDEKRKIDPAKNQKCELTLKVSKGATTCELPDYQYDDSRTAEIAVKNLGLIPIIVKEPHDIISPGYVIRTDPEPGTILEGGSHVTIYVSSGQDIEYTVVPYFTNCTESEVMALLAERGLQLGYVSEEYNESVEAGRVISQTVSQEQQVPSGTKIDFVMSKGPFIVETEETTADDETVDAPLDSTDSSDNIPDDSDEAMEELLDAILGGSVNDTGEE